MQFAGAVCVVLAAMLALGCQGLRAPAESTAETSAGLQELLEQLAKSPTVCTGDCMLHWPEGRRDLAEQRLEDALVALARCEPGLAFNLANRSRMEGPLPALEASAYLVQSRAAMLYGLTKQAAEAYARYRERVPSHISEEGATRREDFLEKLSGHCEPSR